MDWNWKSVLQAANQYGMNGYKPGTPQAPQGYVPYEATLNQRGLSNNMQPDNSVIPGTTYQPDNFGNRQPQAVAQMEAEQQAQAQAEQEALQKQQRIEEIEAEIAEIEQRIAERKRGMAANEDALNTQLAAIEARKINQKDPTSIWRWKAQMDENRRIANAQNKTDNTAKANAMIEIANDLDSIIVDDKMTSQDQKAYLSKLSNMKTLGEKAGVPKSVIDSINAKIAEVKGENKQVTTEKPESVDEEDFDFEGGPRDVGEARATKILQEDPEKITQQKLTTLKRDIKSGKISVSNETKNKIDKLHSQVIDRDNKKNEAIKKAKGLVGKKNLTSKEIEFMNGMKGFKKMTDDYGNVWFEEVL